MKHSLKDREIYAVQVLISALADLKYDLNFEDVQTSFLHWIERLSSIISNN
jgi:hypothetical protein